jgi:hypothetical protein
VVRPAAKEARARTAATEGTIVVTPASTQATAVLAARAVPAATVGMGTTAEMAAMSRSFTSTSSETLLSSKRLEEYLESQAVWAQEVRAVSVATTVPEARRRTVARDSMEARAGGHQQRTAGQHHHRSQPEPVSASPTIGPAHNKTMHCVRTILSRMISSYGVESEAGRIHELFDLIVRESLSSCDRSPNRSYSAVNGNGFPVQFSVSLGATTKALRCLGEVGAGDVSMPERLRLSSLRLRPILALLERQTARFAINRLFAILFPEDPHAVFGWTGGIWMAFGAMPGRPLAFRLYVNQRWGDIADRFVRIGRVFVALGRNRSLALWQQIAGRISAGAVPYGVAFDVTPSGVGRVKVYLACPVVDLRYIDSILDSTGLGHRRDRVMQWLQYCTLDRPGRPPWALLPSFEFDEDDATIGFKLDVSINPLATCDAQMDERIRTYLEKFSFDLEEYEMALRAISCRPLSTTHVERIQYCGTGFDGANGARFNVYLCPDVA